MSGNKEVSAFPNGDNLFEWAATISGSKGTVYDGLTFKLKVSFPADYPFTAPTVTFVTPCYHPNVDGESYMMKAESLAPFGMQPHTLALLVSHFVPSLSLLSFAGAGNICLDILKDKWSASYSVSTLLISLQSLLSDPNVASPLNQHAAQLWENQAEYRKVLIRKYKEATGTGPDA